MLNVNIQFRRRLSRIRKPHYIRHSMLVRESLSAESTTTTVEAADGPWCAEQAINLKFEIHILIPNYKFLPQEAKRRTDRRRP
jgi:hypothetical protein